MCAIGSSTMANAKRHRRKFNGGPKVDFGLYLKACEWRLNTPDPKRELMDIRQWVHYLRQPRKIYGEIVMSTNFDLIITADHPNRSAEFVLRNGDGVQLAYRKTEFNNISVGRQRGLFDLRDILKTQLYKQYQS